MELHKDYMKKVLTLAKKGWGKTNPNPLVGALIVKNGKIIAKGYHRMPGCAHAEVDAFNNAKEDPCGSTLYVNLEPCSHFGRTPPCVKAIIEAGVSEVVIAMEDPNPQVSGQGIKILKDKGIKVTVGVLENEAKKLNEIFVKFAAEKKPFVILKAAMTLDGKIATVCGDSKWITGEKSRHYVHEIRNRVSAIMVGINTVLSDNPSLTTRLNNGTGRDPVRVVVDSKGMIPLDSKVIKSSSGMILATASSIENEKEKFLQERGVKIIKADDKSGYVNLNKLMDRLYKLEIDSVLLEGGGSLNASAMNFGIVDKVMMFIAPKIVGGKSAKTPVEGEGIKFMKEATALENVKVSKFDNDTLIEGYISIRETFARKKGEACLQGLLRK